jgi:hypothetical protein
MAFTAQTGCSCLVSTGWTQEHKYVPCMLDRLSRRSGTQTKDSEHFRCCAGFLTQSSWGTMRTQLFSMTQIKCILANLRAANPQEPFVPHIPESGSSRELEFNGIAVRLCHRTCFSLYVSNHPSSNISTEGSSRQQRLNSCDRPQR